MFWLLSTLQRIRQLFSPMMEAWSTFLQFLSELFSFLIIRTYDTVKYLFHQGFRDGRKRIPPLQIPYLSYSATKLAKMIRERKLTSEELVRAVIMRIREVEPLLNAVVDERFDGALHDAVKADEELAFYENMEELERTKPFLGVPFTVKDCISVEGLLAEIGSEVRKGYRAENNAVSVTRMIEAGGIPLAISNVPEMCLWIESSNRLHGRTNNPHDLHRTTGGSSGGEGALVSSCASVWGIGSDIAGSIRLPSAWCGIFGHKPSPGHHSREGLLPAQGQDIKSEIGVIGPMARSVEDLVAMVKILANNPESLHLDCPVDLGSLRYFFCDHEGTSYISAVQPEVRKQVHRVVNFLKDQYNVEVQPLMEPEKMYQAPNYWFSFLTSKGFPELKTGFDPERTWDPLIELVKHVGGFSYRTINAITISLLDEMHRSDADKCKELEAEFQEYKRTVNELLGNDGILILPSSVTVAPFHHGTLCQPGLYFGLAGLINVLQLPSTVVPMGVDAHGQPLSVQIIAGYGQDRLTLALAQALEDKFGGYIPPWKTFT
ncbi:fatty-acid amide hydrolase 2-like [Tropilaelaps mercedesae]|uniref:Fatty-acid amide hydrolase 2-like n=1 Tax=Tropilaelaps mercedesae TaxID=418985 RepID=A0A1V9X0A4_9ACAR|nr:fatty-acid amide hydrolase 2-like [Tropilaelaps mercedesae]